MKHLSVSELSFSYAPAEGSRTALHNLSFGLERGQTLCVAGANGCGKSTLLRVLAGLLTPRSGSVRFFNEKGEEEERGAAGLVFQEVDYQLFMPTVWEDVAFGLLKDGMKLEEAREEALDALRLVEAEHLAQRPLYALSGGEKQRAALAGVLVTRPPLLLLDEPTAALDPRARRNLIRLLSRLPGTKIIATHDLDMILDLGGSVLILKDGEAAGESAVPGLLAREDFLREAGLELPLSLRGR